MSTAFLSNSKFPLRIPEITANSSHLLKDDATPIMWKENIDSKFESTIKSTLQNPNTKNSVSSLRISGEL